MSLVITILYFLSLLYIFLFSLSQLHLTLLYLKNRHKAVARPAGDRKEYKYVTIQLPVYNEKYVVERLLDAVSRLDYPSDKFDVQVLDDSTDETTGIIREKIASLRSALPDFKLIHRTNRQGFKAGALQHALASARGELVAIFDADFIPGPDFLKRTVPLFDNPAVGAVQTRWGHLNREYSLLTELQAYSLDAHFSIEQTARNAAGSFINFNGTCGVWRRQCILDSGGWSADTLTEDLDLSYRAQLKGWKFKYLEDVSTPGELPVIMHAVKSQQYRWNKGGAEVARKMFFHVLRSRNSITTKVHAFFHLFNSSVFLASLIASVLSIPMLFVTTDYSAVVWLFRLLFVSGLSAIAFFFWIATKQFYRQPGKKFLRLFPGFLVVFMGLSLHNGLAVLEGLIGIRTPFVRTPKFNITGKTGTWRGNAYLTPSVSPLTLLEGLLCLYFIFGVAAGIYLREGTLMVFHCMLALGYGMVFYQTIRPAAHA